MITEKKCSKCHRVLPVENFRKDSGKSSGYRSQCKDCERPRIKNTMIIIKKIS